MKIYTILFLIFLVLSITGCQRSATTTVHEREEVQYGKESKPIKEFWETKDGLHFIGVASDQKTLNGGKRMAQLMANRGISERVSLKLRSEVAGGLDGEGANYISDVIAQVSQNTLSGVTPVQSWHKRANRSDGIVYECYYEVKISKDDYNKVIEGARKEVKEKAPNNEIKERALDALKKL
jgi:hypothetical protein